MSFRRRSDPPRRGERLGADLVASARDAIDLGRRREALPPLLLGPPSPSGRVLTVDWWPRFVTARITAGTGPFDWVEQIPDPDDPDDWIDKPGGLAGFGNLKEVNDAMPGGVRQRIYEVAPDRWRFYDVKAGPPPCRAITVCVQVRNRTNRTSFPNVTNIKLLDAAGNVLDSGPPPSRTVLERCVDVTALGTGATVTAEVTLETVETTGTPCTFTYTKDFTIPTCGTHYLVVLVCGMHHQLTLTPCLGGDVHSNPDSPIATVEFGPYFTGDMGPNAIIDPIGCLKDPEVDPFTVTVTPLIRGFAGPLAYLQSWDCDTTDVVYSIPTPPVAAGFHCGCCQVPAPDVVYLSADAGTGAFVWDSFRGAWFGSVPVQVPNKATFATDEDGRLTCTSAPGTVPASGFVQCSTDPDGQISWSGVLSARVTTCTDPYGNPVGPLFVDPTEHPDIGVATLTCFASTPRPCPGVPINETLTSTPCNPPGGDSLGDKILSLTE